MPRIIRVLFISHRAELGGGELSLLDLIANINNNSNIGKTDNSGYLPSAGYPQIIPFIILGGRGELYNRLADTGYNATIINMPALKRISCGSILKIIRFARANKIDIIHANTTRAAFYSIFAKLTANVKIIWHNRGTDNRGKFEYLLSLFADKLIAISETVKNNLIALGVSRSKIVKIINGISVLQTNIPENTDKYFDYRKPAQTAVATAQTVSHSTNSASQPVKIGLVGRFTAEKGHLQLIECAKKIIIENKSDNYKFIFIGNETFGISVLQDIKKKITEYGIADYFEFTGFIENVIDYIKNRIDIIVIPSQREAFGRVALEAWSARIPVIAFNIEGLAELIDNNRTGVLVEKNNIDELAAVIERLTLDAKLRARLIANASAELQNYDISRTAASVRRLYYEILSKN